MKEQTQRLFGLSPASYIWPQLLPTTGAHDTTGLTYLPRIHIYRDTYLSSL